MRALREQIARSARTPSTVLITGESGVGKELVAHAVHAASSRRDRPFIAVNCGAIPEALLESQLFGHVRGAFTTAVQANPGLFVAADHGTLLLDEIGELPLLLQVKLLRVMEDRLVWPVGGTRPASVDVRIIASTNQICPPRSSPAAFARICSIGSTSCSSRCRRCASAAGIFRCSWITFVGRLNAKLGTGFPRPRARRCGRSLRGRGRAMCGSWRTRLTSGPWCWVAASCSPPGSVCVGGPSDGAGRAPAGSSRGDAPVRAPAISSTCSTKRGGTSARRRICSGSASRLSTGSSASPPTGHRPRGTRAVRRRDAQGAAGCFSASSEARHLEVFALELRDEVRRLRRVSSTSGGRTVVQAGSSP